MTVAAPSSGARIVYPDSDGEPMAENTLQFEWIVKIMGGLDYAFARDPDVFVAGDLFWYPVEGRPDIRMAPDILVAFGRPKGHRPSYMQWREGRIAPQVVFEVLSPGNRYGEMSRKFEFYREHGVEEYYLFNPEPERLELSGFLRKGNGLVAIPAMSGHLSPRLRVQFEVDADGLQVLGPDGRPFVAYRELAQERDELGRAVEAQRDRADKADQRAEEADQRAANALAEAQKLRDQLKALGQPPVA